MERFFFSSLSTIEYHLKRITSFLHMQATPYNQDDFDEAVKNAANANCTLQAGLKISKMIVLGDVATGKTCLVNR